MTEIRKSVITDMDAIWEILEPVIRAGERFQIVGRVPDAFLHPQLGYTDALVMYRKL